MDPDATPRGTTRIGRTRDGHAVHRAVISNGVLTVSLLDMGAIVRDLRLAGVAHPLCLGARDLGSYDGLMSHFGAVIAPVANRIGHGQATIDGVPHRFERNQDGRHTLHSGAASTQHAIWRVADLAPDRAAFEIDLPDGQGGFPGNRHVRVDYGLDGASLSVEITARTDAPTLMNPAWHPYWSLHPTPGEAPMTLQVTAERYLPVDEDTLPRGGPVPVEGTAFDFRTPRRLVPGDVPDLDHNFCLSDAPRALTHAARLTSDGGLRLDLETTAPGLQVFDMHPFGIGSRRTNHARPYPPRAGVALEAQNWPDAPGRAGFPGIDLAPGETFQQATRVTFGKA
ncbi:galactose mutarotase [Palleronia sediminis]|uniref:Galactose mutarotase n=1 Tax=Palleronia sediminis TaxID=2547833 RepID=A0A4R6AC48_9RHOB|nr:aldose epimerase family protein [Palleronia sediminis]TDL81390.1 galactose mutarotase [Palleronia sediminis]